MLIGAHVSGRGGLHNAVDRAVQIGAEVFQIHPASARMWRRAILDDEALAAFSEKLEASGIRRFWLHGLYLINLASPQEWLLQRSVDSLVHHMEVAARLGAEGVVFHPGSHLGAGFESVLPQMTGALRQVLESSDPAVRLLIENSAGSGGCVGCSFEQVGRLVAGAASTRAGVCLDTQHAFASGYDFRDPESLSETLRAFSRDIGFERLELVHANDSRTALGSNADRHANIGEGAIGVAGFRLLLEDPRLRAVPWVMEVPGVDRQGPDREQLELLRSCARLQPAGR